MSDEIWSDIIYDNRDFYTYSAVSEEAKRKSFTVYGFSKSFGIAGLRIGAVLCNDQEILEDFTEKSNLILLLKEFHLITDCRKCSTGKSKTLVQRIFSHLQQTGSCFPAFEGIRGL
jgi:aspartate/methionine/tyrosine aminotransferase